MHARPVRTALLVLLAAAAGLAGPASAAGPYPPPSSVTAQADPDRVAPGECTTFSGTGFNRLSQLALDDDGASRGTTTTDLDGSFSTQICFSSDAKRGKHVLGATGPTSAGTQTASAVVRVVGVSQSATQGSSTGQAGTGSAPGASGPGTTAAGRDLPSLPRTDGSLGGSRRALAGDASSSSFLDGLSALLLSLVSALGLALLALLLLIAERRHRRRREDAALALA